VTRSRSLDEATVIVEPAAGAADTVAAAQTLRGRIKELIGVTVNVEKA
jgi:hypothetical protein